MFEEYQDKMYWEVEECDEEEDITPVEYVDFDKIKKIESLIDPSKFTVMVKTGYIDMDYEQFMGKSLSITGYYGEKEKYASANLLKSDDEWYWVEHFVWEKDPFDAHDDILTVQIRYKCDQIEGLIECLKDLKFI